MGFEVREATEAEWPVYEAQMKRLYGGPHAFPNINVEGRFVLPDGTTQLGHREPTHHLNTQYDTVPENERPLSWNECVDESAWVTWGSSLGSTYEPFPGRPPEARQRRRFHTVGAGCVIGYNSVVARDMKPGTVWETFTEDTSADLFPHGRGYLGTGSAVAVIWTPDDGVFTIAGCTGWNRVEGQLLRLRDEPDAFYGREHQQRDFIPYWCDFYIACLDITPGYDAIDSIPTAAKTPTQIAHEQVAAVDHVYIRGARLNGQCALCGEVAAYDAHRRDPDQPSGAFVLQTNRQGDRLRSIEVPIRGAR